MSTFDLNAVSGIINTQAKEVKTIIATEIAKGTSYNSHKKLATRKAVVDKFTTQTAMGDLFMADIVPDGGIPATQSPVVGFQKTWVQVQAMISVSVSYQSMKFMFTEGASRSEINQGLGQTLKKKVLNLMVGLEKLKDYYMQAQLAQGFTTSFLFQSISQTATVPPTLVDTTTADGVAFWSENHLREDAGTNWSNVIRTTVPSPVLSEASIAAAHRIHSLKKDATGSPLTSVLDTVIVVRGSQAAQEAKRIKAMLDSGRYPAVTPGVSGSFNEAARIPSFDIIELN